MLVATKCATRLWPPNEKRHLTCRAPRVSAPQGPHTGPMLPQATRTLLPTYTQTACSRPTCTAQPLAAAPAAVASSASPWHHTLARTYLQRQLKAPGLCRSSCQPRSQPSDSQSSTARQRCQGPGEACGCTAVCSRAPAARETCGCFVAPSARAQIDPDQITTGPSCETPYARYNASHFNAQRVETMKLWSPR